MISIVLGLVLIAALRQYVARHWPWWFVALIVVVSNLAQVVVGQAALLVWGPTDWAETLQRGTLKAAAYEAFIGAALIEESSRLLAILIITSLFRARVRTVADCPALGAIGSIAYGIAETLLFLPFGELASPMGRIVALISHGCDGLLMGFFVGHAIRTPGRRAVFWSLALAVPVVLHGLYDLPFMVELPEIEQDAMPPPETLLILLVPAVLLTEFAAATWILLHIRKRST
jgi:hypothetical protein